MVGKQKKLNFVNTTIRYTAILKRFSNEKFRYSFFIFAQNINCGYTLEPPQWGGSNEYPQSKFYSKNKKKCIAPLTPVLPYKSGV